ncbi:MAG: RHS repeat-associated core domain-containing protein [Terriglobia bacterium]
MNSTDEVPSGSQTLNGECLRQPACTNIQETYAYNNRMQMAVAELGTSSSHTSDSCREYSYDAHTVPSGCSESSSAWPTGTTNNGNVGGYYYADSANTGLSHPAAYTYDGVNRLIGAAATGNASYSQAYSYDIYGNLNCSPSGPGCVTFSYNPNTNTNQITTSGYSYDPAGNLIGDGMYTYQWDAEAHLTAVYQSGNVVSLNTYNALGQRVEDIASTNTTDEAYGAGGDLLLRYTGDSNSRSFVPFNGRLLAEYYCGGMIFDHPDEIGSATTATDCTGNNLQERLYYPFGEFWTGVGSLGIHQEFAQLPDYDAETDQYNTPNRHYSPMGRWMSPDPDNTGADPSDPQTWDAYAYVRNNPTSLADPSGSMYCDPNSAVVDKSGNTVGYSDCVSEETGASDQYSLHFAPQQKTVSGAQATQADLLFAVATGVERAGPTVNGFALATGAVTGLAMLPAAVGGTGVTSLTLPGSLGEMITGLYSGVTRQALLAAARIVGPTVTVITNLTRDPSELQALSTATGEGAEALAAAARSGPGVQTFTAEVPKALMVLLERAGLAFPSITSMGTATAQEWYFNSQAMEFVAKYFK